MDKPFLGCGVAQFHTAKQQEQPARAMGSTLIVGRGQRPMVVVGSDARGCPHSKKPSKQSQSDQRAYRKAHGRKQRWRERSTAPVRLRQVVDLDEIPPLEEDEAIAELDAAIDEAGDEGEEGPKPLDEADIREAA